MNSKHNNNIFTISKTVTNKINMGRFLCKNGKMYVIDYCTDVFNLIH